MAKQVEKKIYFLRDVAALLEVSENALRVMLCRRNWDAVPPPFKLGGKLAWRVQDFDAFLEGKAEAAMREAGLV